MRKTKAPQPKPLMSPAEVADYLGVTDRTIRNLLSAGHLRAYKVGNKTVRFRRDEVDAAMTPMGAAAATGPGYDAA